MSIFGFKIPECIKIDFNLNINVGKLVIEHTSNEEAVQAAINKARDEIAANNSELLKASK